jgi:hypothetical protein
VFDAGAFAFSKQARYIRADRWTCDRQISRQDSVSPVGSFAGSVSLVFSVDVWVVDRGRSTGRRFRDHRTGNDQRWLVVRYNGMKEGSSNSQSSKVGKSLPADQ